MSDAVQEVVTPTLGYTLPNQRTYPTGTQSQTQMPWMIREWRGHCTLGCHLRHLRVRGSRQSTPLSEAIGVSV
jgi:hypothetical protein